MRKKLGLRGALSAIALGVAMGGTASVPATSQQTASLNSDLTATGNQSTTLDDSVDLAAICAEILATKTVREFNETLVAVAARDNDADVCHDLAEAHWLLLNNPRLQTGAIGPAGATGDGADAAGGYNFI